MKYSKATNYALHILLHLAVATPNQRVGVQQLAEQQDISPTYLSKILTKLVKAGMIESSTGANGGYKLKPDWESISFLDVIHAIEGSASLFGGCLNDNPDCLIQKVMISAEEKMEEELRQHKISDLAKKATVVF
ncbi:Rrf2 family transcriptional regulator [Ornithinibacillus bavariensis]|uniref:Rrf2 family transcriptional regulator n=1 Tax=Ornithinibacillus bavariensis TaxID=545502 RepID=A0A919XAJ9_9BACI|nr:Rrf2 family transcriptional regulator [Ornithinibacillus bavariensis]GIO27412.1 Rrf2 family transcriptional regulator [Ornithinibacillus bavariensis]